MAKLVMSPEVKELVSGLRARIMELELELEQALTRKQGIKSSGVEDKWTDMPASQLRGAIIKRGGNPDEIVEGLHSRQRSIVMREWLREHKGPSKGKRITNHEVRETADGKPKRTPKPIKATRKSAKRKM